jgi:hypothetical protein
MRGTTTAASPFTGEVWLVTSSWRPLRRRFIRRRIGTKKATICGSCLGEWIGSWRRTAPWQKICWLPISGWGKSRIVYVIPRSLAKRRVDLRPKNQRADLSSQRVALEDLQLEALFGRLRRHQRRISGRNSTRELRDFGQAQALFMAECETDLLRQIQRVPWVAYRQYRQRLAEVDAPRQFFRCLHHDPSATAQTLISQHTARCKALAQNKTLADQSVQNDLHTN